MFKDENVRATFIEKDSYGIKFFHSDNFYLGLNLAFFPNKKEPKEYDYYAQFSNKWRAKLFTPIRMFLREFEGEEVLIGKPRRAIVWLLKRGQKYKERYTPYKLFEIKPSDGEIFDEMIELYGIKQSTWEDNNGEKTTT